MTTFETLSAEWAAMPVGLKNHVISQDLMGWYFDPGQSGKSGFWFNRSVRDDAQSKASAQGYEHPHHMCWPSNQGYFAEMKHEGISRSRPRDYTTDLNAAAEAEKVAIEAANKANTGATDGLYHMNLSRVLGSEPDHWDSSGVAFSAMFGAVTANATQRSKAAWITCKMVNA